MKTYDLQVETSNRPPGTPVRFNFFARSYIWPAFFLGPIWFFYRKMWGWGIGIVAVTIALGFLPITRNISLPIGLALGGSGALIYLGHAVSKIEALRAEGGGVAALDANKLATLGGVSAAAGWISGVLYFLVIAASLYVIASAPPKAVPALDNPHLYTDPAAPPQPR